MGVPKFFRYISERYPCLSEVVSEYQLPEFDTLYLDMNGIIHVCSHPNDTDPHFRITEEKIFRDVFHYIETLFRMIQPKKLFFMAVDGVAPRAKMNQQRGRRFRSAKEAEVAESKAKDRGEVLPSAERFDSNCITPGTEFMTRLQAQLKYFATFKISTDKLWRKVKVILSGHEVPGEGEHKIMDYIRYMKSQPEYDPNTRHCLYGLDADLIMLGLCTHEPHFSLLREEVKYVKSKSQKRIPTPEEITFYLLHLSLMREYLDLEFQQLKTTLPFPYDLEHIIDDWVLMGFLVGNDFIPHLPDLHINKGALPILFQTYIETLPSLGGYINEGGFLRLDRFQKYMEKLATFDLEQFKEINADLLYFESKTGRKMGGKERHSYKNSGDPATPPKNKDLAALIASTDEIMEGSEDDDDNYVDIDSDEEDEDSTLFAEFSAYKNNYYMQKMEYDKVTPEVLRSQGEGYVRAIQWNLNYYYNGCCSWSWYYPHHYAPFISDVKNFSGFKLEYELGQPFLPFQQLLAVLPAASKKLLPEAYHYLMENEESPIIGFYPKEFRTDMNGKRQEWEAVVLIPFINEEQLLDAMETREHELTEEEKSRNRHGRMQIYTYTPENQGAYISPAYFPALANHHAKEENIYRDQLYVEPSKLVKGLCPGVQLEVYYSGFPTLKHIPFTATLQKSKVKVFETASQGENMILTILPQGHPNVSEVATQLLGKSIYVNWPHFFEARVVAVANEQVRFSLKPEDDSVISEDMNKTMLAQWSLSKKGIEDKYMTRMGIDLGKTEILVYACTLEDKKYVMDGDKMRCEKQWVRLPIAYALQTTRADIAVHDPTPDLNITIEKLFPPDTVVFAMDQQHYGTMGKVMEIVKNKRIKVNVVIEPEPNIEEVKIKMKKLSPQYMAANSLATRLSLTSHLLSRITGTIYIMSGETQDTQHRPFKLNIGLNLKFNKKNEEVCGYTRRCKNSGYWLYSAKAEEEVREYIQKFPEVFDYLKSNSSSDDIRDKDLYPEDTANKLAELGSWLKERGSTTAERQSCGAQVLSEEVVKALEEVIDLHFKTDDSEKPASNIYLKPSTVYLPKSKLGQAPDPKATHYQLFDRVVSVRESHTVPLGCRGTIIGIHNVEISQQIMYDILFDKEFTGGLKLRCSPHRGYRLPAQALINLTHGLGNDANRAQGKPTAVVEPSGIEEETSTWNNNVHNSAFASWRDKSGQETGGSPFKHGSDHKNRRQYQEPQQFSWAMDQKAQGRQYTSSNKASPNVKGQIGMKTVGQPEVEQCVTLKKLLKIKDDPIKKLPTQQVPMKLGLNSHNYCMELLSLHQKLGIKLPRYLYSDTKDGSIICTVVCGNGKEFRGSPAFANDPAAESAAQHALQWLDQENHKRGIFGTVSNPSPFLPSTRPPLLLNPPQRSAFPSPNRPCGSNVGWMREPAKPSTLPQPPTNWYLNQGINTFKPEWQTGIGRRPNQNYFLPTHQFQHNQQMQHTPSNNQYNKPGQYNQVLPWQQRTPFIPLQAESRIRQQSQAVVPQQPQEPARIATPSEVVNSSTSQTPTSNATNSRSNTARPQRPRIAAYFSQPLNYNSPPDRPQ